MSSLFVSGSFDLANGIPLAVTQLGQVISGSFGADRIAIQVSGGTATYSGSFSYFGSAIDSSSTISGYLYTTASLNLELQLTQAIDISTYFSLAGNPQAFVQYVLSGDDWINGYDNSKAQTLYGYAGNDTFNMGGGNDSIYGGNGNDLLNGGGGADHMFGGIGDDSYYVDNPQDLIDEGVDEGNDSVTTTVSFTLPANTEALYLRDLFSVTNPAMTVPNPINGTGNALDNQIYGNAYANVLTGMAGDDWLRGNGGADTAVFSGLRHQYALTGAPSEQASISGPDGNDTLSGIEALAFIDGTLTYDPDAHIAQVSRLYQATLGRSPDPLGLNFHTSRLDAGNSLNVIAGDFINSPEFQSIYGPLNDSAFVATLYLNVLGRTAEAEGLAYWTGRLAAGASRGEIVTGFSESRENIENHASTYGAGLWDMDETAASVARLYWGTLDRMPDADGLLNWTNGIKAGQISLTQAADGFVGSPEFQATYGKLDDAQFANRLYQNVLDRAADPEGLAYWLGLLATGTSRASVTLGFTESFEFQDHTLASVEDGIVYAGLVGQSPLPT